MKIWVNDLPTVTLIWRQKWRTVLVMNIVNLLLISLLGELVLLSLKLTQHERHCLVWLKYWQMSTSGTIQSRRKSWRRLQSFWRLLNPPKMLSSMMGNTVSFVPLPKSSIKLRNQRPCFSLPLCQWSLYFVFLLFPPTPSNSLHLFVLLTLRVLQNRIPLTEAVSPNTNITPSNFLSFWYKMFSLLIYGLCEII